MGCGGSKPEVKQGTVLAASPETSSSTTSSRSSTKEESSRSTAKPEPNIVKQHRPAFARESMNIEDHDEMSSFMEGARRRPTLSRMDLKTSLQQAGDRLVLIKFYEDGCEDCEAVSELYEEFVSKYPGCLFLEANVEDNMEAVNQLRVKFLPTFIAFKNHLEVGRLVDTKVEDIEDLIRKNRGDVDAFGFVEEI